MPVSRSTWTLAALLALAGGTLVPLPAPGQEQDRERAVHRLLAAGRDELEADRPEVAVKFFTKALANTNDRATENELRFFAAYAHFQRGRAIEDENSREKCARARGALDAYETARTHLDETGDYRPDAQDRIRQALGTLLYRQRQIIGKACPGDDRDEALVDPSDARRPNRITPPRQRRPPLEAERQERGARDGDDAERLPVTFEAVLVEPSSPTEEQRVSVGVAAEPKPPHEIERIVVRIGGSEYYSRFGEHRFDRMLGPFERGTHVLEILAEGPEGRTSHTVRREIRVRSAGRSVIEGRITGEPELVTEVQLLDDDRRRVLQRVTPDRAGRYRFVGLAAGSYWIHVAAGGKRGDVRVEGGPNVRLRVDGRSSYERGFRVTCREGCR